jgi:hypothetical protein
MISPSFLRGPAGSIPMSVTAVRCLPAGVRAAIDRDIPIVVRLFARAA